MRRFVKLGTLALLTLPLHLVVFLAVIGVPRPPAISGEGMERVGWAPVLQDAAQLWRARTSVSHAAWMPDGSGILVRARRWLVDSRLHLVTGPGARPELLSRIPRNATVHMEPGRSYAVLAWDRDGDELHRLYRWDLGDAEPVPLTPATERAAFGAFEPDGERVAYTSTRRNGRDFDLYVMDPSDPASDRRLLELDGMWAVTGWSPSGRELLLAHIVSNMASALYLLDLERGALRPLPGSASEAHDEATHQARHAVAESSSRGTPARHAHARWSPDGTTLFYASDRGTEFMHLRRRDPGTGEEIVLTGDVPWDVSSVQLSGDGGVLLVGINEDGRTRYYVTDPMGRRLEPFRPFDSGQISPSLHPRERRVAVNHVDDSGLVRTYIYDLTTRELVQWAGPPPADSRRDAGREGRLVRYPTFDEVDGEPRLISAFVYPGEGEGPRPVVIDIHGGPEAQARLRSSPSPLQSQGITLITPNVRGSTGYGRSFAALDDGYRREDAVRDIGALLDWIALQPDLDESRVAVTGGSYGGYMVLASLVHFGARIRCGVDIVGVSNFVTFLENTADYRRDLRRAEYGDERIPEMRAFLESISPLNNAERIASPLMVIQGANDPRVPVGESRQMVDRVRKNGLEVIYMEADNEGHGFRHPWNAFYAQMAQRDRLEACLLGDGPTAVRTVTPMRGG